MTDALGQLLGSGVGVAISPIPVVAVILMLTTPRGKVTGVTFMLGWLVGLSVATGVVLLLADGADDADSAAADGAHIATLVVGLLFLALAVKQWKSRPKPGVEPELPKWMAGIDGFAPPKCFALGALLSGVNPKNLAMAVGAGVALAETGSSGSEMALGALIFILVGSVTVAGPVLGLLVAPSRTAPMLEVAKRWLAENNATVMIVLFTVLGATRVGEGLGSLFR
jgi:threonine/homoserine/homoserine lactone efflux protein